MKTPEFLRQLMSSPEYMDKNSDEYAAAVRYLNLLYPGTAQTDATGRMTKPNYDMTLDQFNEAQAEFDRQLAAAKRAAESNGDSDTSEDAARDTDTEDDTDILIVIKEIIDVRVLMPWGDIENKKLYVYELKTSDEEGAPVETLDDSDETFRVWRWHAEDGENTCDECGARDEVVYESENDIPDIPVHPNCRCTITEEEITAAGQILSSKPYKPKKTTPVPEKALNTPAEKMPHKPEEKATFEKPVNTKPGQYAVFNGKTLTLYQDGKPIRSWEAVSGRPGYQSPEYQDRKSTGPIPEGTYVARTEELQFYKDISWLDRQKSALGGGTWRGGTDSWGNSRVWLKSSEETNTYGRGGFSIHGGTTPGSAGCIDLTSWMDDFTKRFESNGHDVLLRVEY